MEQILIKTLYINFDQVGPLVTEETEYETISSQPKVKVSVLLFFMTHRTVLIS